MQKVNPQEHLFDESIFSWHLELPLEKTICTFDENKPVLQDGIIWIRTDKYLKAYCDIGTSIKKFQNAINNMHPNLNDWQVIVKKDKQAPIALTQWLSTAQATAALADKPSTDQPSLPVNTVEAKQLAPSAGFSPAQAQATAASAVKPSTTQQPLPTVNFSQLNPLISNLYTYIEKHYPNDKQQIDWIAMLNVQYQATRATLSAQASSRVNKIDAYSNFITFIESCPSLKVHKNPNYDALIEIIMKIRKAISAVLISLGFRTSEDHKKYCRLFTKKTTQREKQVDEIKQLFEVIKVRL